MIVPLVTLLVVISGLDKCGQISDYDQKTGRTALHKAALKLNLECITDLLKRGADPNAQTLQGSTPLHTVANNGDDMKVIEATEVLLEHQADVEIEDKQGEQPVQRVYRNERFKDGLNTKRSLITMMAKKGKISRQLTKPCLWGFLCLPSLPMASELLDFLDNMLYYTHNDHEANGSPAQNIADQNTIKNLNTKLAESTKKIEEMKVEKQTIMSEKANLQTEVAAKDGLISTLNTQIKDTGAQLKNTITEFDKCKNSASDIESDLAKQLELSAVQKTQISNLTTELATANDSAKLSAKSISDFQLKIESQKTEIDQLTSSNVALVQCKADLSTEQAKSVESEKISPFLAKI